MKRTFPFLVFLILLNSCATEFKSATFETTSIDTAFEADIMAAANDYMGNFGYVPYCCEEEVSIGTVDDLLELRNSDARFFSRLENICGRFNTIRDQIYNKELTANYELF